MLDFDSPESVTAAFSGIEKLFLVTPGSPAQGRQEENLLAEAKRAGVKRIVKLSGKIADHHASGFSEWNREAERRIKDSGISYTILRGNYFMQNFFGNAPQIREGLFTAGPASKRIAFVDTRDVAAVAVTALTDAGHDGKTYDLNGPELLDGHAQAAALTRVLSRPVRYLDVSVDEFAKQLKSCGLPAWMVDAFAVSMADPEIPGNQSSAELERILHHKPGTFAQFVTDYRSAFQA